MYCSIISSPTPEKCLSPYPGDGVCPTTSQFNDTVKASYDNWKTSGSEANQNSKCLSTSDCLLNLLQQIPGFYARPLKAFSILDNPFPQVQYALDWITTTDLTCNQPLKRTYHYQTLGVPEPVICEFSDASDACSYWPGIEVDQIKYISQLVVAWTFILCSRWVEILQSAGEKAYLQQSEKVNDCNFWKVIAEQRWRAIIVRGGSTFYAPWCLTRHDTAPWFVQ